MFVGRDAQLREITALASHLEGPRSLLVLAAPLSGSSEFLRQAYDQLFAQRGGASPVYFSFSRGDQTNAGTARRFLNTFLVQLVAHRRDDPTLVSASPTMRELLDLVAPSDYEWAERLIQTYERARAEGDERALVRACLNAPQMASARGARSIILLDDVHVAGQLRGEFELGPELAQIAAASDVPFVLAGLRRRLLDVLNDKAETPRLDRLLKLHLDQLSGGDARRFVEYLADDLGVELKDETRDLVVQQLEGSPCLIAWLIQSASESSVSLDSFTQTQKLYVDELMGGRINRRFNSLLEEIVPTVAVRRSLLRVLHESASNVGGKSPVEAWWRRLNLETPELERVMTGLHMQELASFHATYVETGPSLVWRDYLRAAYRLQVSVEPRALVVADTLIETLKRAPQTMARHYRREAAMKLSELMERFNFQRVPASLLHYDRFGRVYRGVPAEEVAAGLDAETDLIRLPQIVHTASCASFHPPMLLVADEERCAVAHGFDATPFTDANESVWIAAEIESKLEAGRALTEVWLDRLTQVAHACGFGRVRLWLVSPEGFSAEASELLNEREAYGSSRQQLEILTARLRPDTAAETERPAGDEFEMVIPMGGDNELIAAHAVEQIARRLDFQPKEINQIKTALVEACINASEHSFSPDRKIYQRFRVENDKLVVTVSSRGLAINPYSPENGSLPAEQNNGHEAGEGVKGRRGWGLKLIRTLMDEVEFERVDDGTRLRMTKYLRK
jgi:serine/threonine-protein kinase RsbW